MKTSLVEKIRDIVSLEAPRHERGRKKAKVISLCSQKGGVGKTTTAVNLGTTLTYFHNKKTLVIDLDPQGHVQKSLGGIIPSGQEYTPVSKILTLRRGELLDAVVPTELENFDFTPGDKELIGAEATLNQRIGREFVLRQSLEIARTHYDFILLDCPPSLGNLTINALCASDYAILPCEMSALAFEGVSDILETLREIRERLNRELKLLGVVFTRVDRRNMTMNDLIAENMKKFVNGKLFKTRVTVNTSINKAQLEGQPIFHFAPSSTGAENYQALAVEVLGRLKK